MMFDEQPDGDPHGECAAEIARLSAELEKCAAALHGALYMDPLDGGGVSVSEQLRRMAIDAARYRYMRAKATFQDRNGPGLYWYLPRWDRELPIGERLDRAIDANIKNLEKVLQEIEKKAEAALAATKDKKDEAYRQRNVLVSTLARLFPSGVRKTNIDRWSEDWHGCVYIDLPAGQISYHYHDSQAHLFADLPAYEKPWDGHDKETVEQRLSLVNKFAVDLAATKEQKP